MELQNKELQTWINEVAGIAKPDNIHICDGTQAEYETLKKEAIKTKVFYNVDEEKWPGCLYHHSHPTDVARSEGRTLICTKKKEDAGVTNNWMAPEDAKKMLLPLYDGCMKGRTLYVMPYIMGPIDSPYSKVGVEVTDSLYVVISMRIMTRLGTVALKKLGADGSFVKGFHAMSDLDPEKRYIVHFPEEKTIWSIGSGYGGNALLGKKCHALRISSFQALQEGWMAEHMLILGLEAPTGEITYMAAAFPSACGKTNLAMLQSPLEEMGYKIWTIGDDIAWLNVGPDGQLYAMNPENGFFGVAPGTSAKTNPNALKTTTKNSLFTNVVRGKKGEIWWEDMDMPAPAEGYDWLGNDWTPDSKTKGAHPNSRFTAPVSQCPTLSPKWEDPQGVPISAIIFGGRRARLAPLVYQTFDWNHGVYTGATMASEKTAAAEGTVGEVRRDPMAMLPFCGYNMATYFQHWINMGKKITKAPKIFHVNWFRRNAEGKFLWPGFGENVRVLSWIADRTQGKGEATETPIGYVPTKDSLMLDGVDVPDKDMAELLKVDNCEWKKEVAEQKTFLSKFGTDLPEALSKENEKLANRLG